MSRQCAAALRRLWTAVHGDESGLEAATELVARGVTSPPAGWRSLVSDDHSPVELSLAYTRRNRAPELRLLVEAQGDAPTASAQGRAGAQLEEWLREQGAQTERLGALEDLFFPAEHRGSFSRWHAAIFSNDGRTRTKIYVDPFAHGRARAADVVERALARLGNPGAWRAVARLAERGPLLDELRFFSLDLVDPAEARIKVYVSKHRASVQELRRAASSVRHHDDDAFVRFVGAVTGGATDGIFAADRPVVTCLDFVGDDPTPRHFTLHFPARAYAAHDGEARLRAMAALQTLGHDAAPFDAALAAFATRELSAGSGMIPYVSFRAEQQDCRVTVYLSTEANHIAPPHAPVSLVSAAPSLRSGGEPSGSIDQLIRRFEDEPITWHPFLQRLAREPLAMERLRLVILNFQEGITRDFGRRLAQTVARVDDESIRTILAKQLNDELGDGDPSRAHRLLFDRFVEGMRGYGHDPVPDDVLEPGRRLGAVLEDIYVASPDPYLAVGAALMMEIFGRQVDQFLGDQFRRQTELPPIIMEWLTLHEALEVEHVDEVFELARHIPEGAPTQSALRGVEALATAGWAFFDELYRRAWSA